MVEQEKVEGRSTSESEIVVLAEGRLLVQLALRRRSV
jgi:hypothetical protein